MKRLACAIAALAVLFGTCPPVWATYQGELQRPYRIVVIVDNTSAGGPTALTVRYVGPRLDEIGGKRLEEILIATVPGGSRTTLTFPKPGKGVKRVIIEVDPSRGQTPSIEVLQNELPFSFTELITGHDHLVFDVVGPEPAEP